MYINKNTGEYPLTGSQIREAYPNTSFPSPFVAPEDYAVVFQAPPPAYDIETQGAREIQPELTSKGVYEQRWEIYDLSPEQIEANRKNKVPTSVTMRQARIALLEYDLLDDVDVVIENIPDPIQKRKAKIEWEYSQEVQRHNGFVSVIAPMLGLTEEQTDDLFILAATK